MHIGQTVGKCDFSIFPFNKYRLIFRSNQIRFETHPIRIEKEIFFSKIECNWLISSSFFTSFLIWSVFVVCYLDIQQPAQHIHWTITVTHPIIGPIMTWKFIWRAMQPHVTVWCHYESNFYAVDVTRIFCWKFIVYMAFSDDRCI